MTDRFTTMLDCVHVGFLPDGILDELSTPATIGSTRVGGIDLNKARMRNCARGGPGAGGVSRWLHGLRSRHPGPGHDGQPQGSYSIRQAAYDLRKLRGKHLVDKHGRSRRYQVPEDAARTIAGLSVLRDKVIVPILAGLRADQNRDLRPTDQNPIDALYDRLRHDMRALIRDLGINTEGDRAA